MIEMEHHLPRGVLAAQAPRDQSFFLVPGKAGQVHTSLSRTVAKAPQVSRDGSAVHRARKSPLVFTPRTCRHIHAVLVCAVNWARLEASCDRALHRMPPRSAAVRVTLRLQSC